MQNDGVVKQFQKNHLPQLDGIKGIICFFIIFIHYYNRTPSYDFPVKWLPGMLVEKGWMFVEFFFILSGFIFAYSHKSRMGGYAFKPYMLARIKRLYPSVLFITLFDVLTRIVDVCLNGGGTRMTFAGILQTLTFTTTWIYNGEPFPTVIWYIHVLLLCYVVYYFIGKRKTNTAYITCVIGLLLFGWLLYVKEWSIPFLYRNIGRGYLAFAVGLMLYEFQTNIRAQIRQGISYGAMALAALTLVLAHVFTFDKVYGDVLLCCTMFLFPAAVLCLLNISWVAWIFSRKPLVWLGKLSMSTFLVHVPVMYLIKALCYQSGALPFNEASTFVIVLAIIFAVSTLWYHLIEKKLIPGFVRLFEHT